MILNNSFTLLMHPLSIIMVLYCIIFKITRFLKLRVTKCVFFFFQIPLDAEILRGGGGRGEEG